MPLTSTSFLYSPARQGYDLSSWKTIAGTPAIAAGLLNLKAAGNGEAAHYADILKGDISFNVTPLTQGIASLCSFGLASIGGSQSKIMFSLTANFTCITTNGSTTTTSPILQWNTAWEGVPTVFRIIWEAGRADFFVNDTLVYQVSDASVPAGPLCLDLKDYSTVGNMAVGDISVRGSQSINFNPKIS